MRWDKGVCGRQTNKCDSMEYIRIANALQADKSQWKCHWKWRTIKLHWNEMKNEVKGIRTFVVSGYYARHSRRERLEATEGRRRKKWEPTEWKERPESIYSDLNKRNWMRHENRLLTLILSLSLSRSHWNCYSKWKCFHCWHFILNC